MGKHGQEIRARIKAFYERIIAVLRIKRVLEWAKEITRKKNFFESVKTVTSCILALTVVFGYLQWRATVKDQSANRFLNIIDKLGNKDSESVRAGAVITMGAHLKENYKEYHDQSIRVLVIHLAKESSPTVRTKILELLKSMQVNANHIIGPLNSEIRQLTLEIKKGSTWSLFEPNIIGKPNENLPLIEPYITGEPNENLVDMIELLVTVLGKIPTEKLDLSNAFLVSHSKDINFKNAKLEGADLNHAILGRVDLTNAVLQGANLEDALLTEVILKNADLSGARLARANLASYDLRNAKFVKADLCGAILQDADMAEAILDKANMYGADLTNAILEHASLRSANMTGAHLELANLKVANLENANLSGADLSRADLTGAYLTAANLAAATLKGAELEVKDIEGANLEDADLRAKVLFGIDSKKFQSDLDKGTISKELYKEFEDNRIYLSQSVAISMEEKDHRWLITDKDYEQTYTVRKEDDQLKIYEKTKLDPIELFSIDSKNFQNELDDGTISEGLQQEFENNGIYLSKNITVSVKEKGRIWLINDKDNEATYTVRKEELLNICKETKFKFEDIKKAKNWQNAIFDDDTWQKLSSQKD